MAIPSKKREAQAKYGFAKVRGVCMLARSRGFKYIWIDTCCIDKASSAELTEAINSMYNWYKTADICFAFLSDVNNRENLTSSLWFTRGWTLQELIAPTHLEFYSGQWQSLGTRKEHSFPISDSTGIDIGVLLGGDPTKISVARRMYWAAGRNTTRVEDEAYCLMGLFDVNMPLIYGEGRKAFQRLQEDIIRKDDDQSIFAWYPKSFIRGSIDILASSPKAFLRSGAVSPHPSRSIGRKPTTMTNQGISLELMLRPLPYDASEYGSKVDSPSDVEAILDCQIGDVPGTFPIIRLRDASQQETEAQCSYYRVFRHRETRWTQYASISASDLLDDSQILGLDPMQPQQPAYQIASGGDGRHWEKRQITITHRPPPQYFGVDFWIVSLRARGFSARIDQAHPPAKWDGVCCRLRCSHRRSGIEGVLRLQLTESFMRISSLINQHPFVSLLLGCCWEQERQLNPWCRLVHYTGIGDLARIVSDYQTNKIPKHSEADLKPEHLLDLEHGYGLKASAKLRKVSGVMYFIVCLEPRVPGLEKNELSILRDDESD